MTFVHSRNTVVQLSGGSVAATGGTVDLSTYTKSSEISNEADTHDVTTYGKTRHVYTGGLGDGTIKMDGIYDNTATLGPRAVLEPLVGTTCTFTRRIEGTGSGKPQDRVSVVVQKYVETSPVADMVTWSAEFQMSDTLDTTAQS